MPICERSKYRPNPFLLCKNYIVSPVANSSTSRNPLFPFLNLFPTWVQVILKNPSLRLVPDLGTSEIPDAAPLAKLARSNLVPIWYEARNDSYKNDLCTICPEVIFYSRRVGGNFTFRQFVGKLFCNFRPTWFEVIRRNTNR